MNGKILLVEDEPDILEIIRYNLDQAGFSVVCTEDGEAGLEAVQKELPDLIVLDLMLPGIDGLEVCKVLKQHVETREVPILMLTARVEEVDRIVGLELGADDYMAKPFSARELVLRIRAILRRSKAPEPEASDRLRIGGVTIDLAAHRVYINGEALDLTTTEFNLLVTLVERRGRVQSRENLLHSVWGYEYGGYGRTVDTHIRRLREKLGEESRMVETVRGVGYRFRSEVS
ncbi:MAG: response regulator transcription factor [bacterium]|nr:response regulator transcription factor [bacterium]